MLCQWLKQKSHHLLVVARKDTDNDCIVLFLIIGVYACINVFLVKWYTLY